MTAEDPTKRDLTAAELAAWNGLIAGELDPLADLLEEGDGLLHPILQRWLVKLIRGSVDESDFRLVADKHPDLKHISHGPRAKRLASLNTMQTALIVFHAGGLDDVKLEAAIEAAIAETGQSRRTVFSHWSKHKMFLKAMRAHGVLGKANCI